MRILIAEDEPLVRKTIERTLAKGGHAVTSFEDGDLLWEAYQESPAEVVVTDWVMPRMTGIELTRRIRRMKSMPYTHILLVTSLSPSEHMLEAFQAGADDFVSKPFDARVLSARVDAAERGMMATAEHGLRQALEICQRALGPEHASLLEALAALTDVARKQRSYVRCRAFLRRQVAISKDAYGAEDPRTLRLLTELEELGSFEEGL